MGTGERRAWLAEEAAGSSPRRPPEEQPPGCAPTHSGPQCPGLASNGSRHWENREWESGKGEGRGGGPAVGVGSVPETWPLLGRLGTPLAQGQGAAPPTTTRESSRSAESGKPATRGGPRPCCKQPRSRQGQSPAVHTIQTNISVCTAEGASFEVMDGLHGGNRHGSRESLGGRDEGSQAVACQGSDSRAVSGAEGAGRAHPRDAFRWATELRGQCTLAAGGLEPGGRPQSVWHHVAPPSTPPSPAKFGSRLYAERYLAGGGEPSDSRRPMLLRSTETPVANHKISMNRPPSSEEKPSDPGRVLGNDTDAGGGTGTETPNPKTAAAPADDTRQHQAALAEETAPASRTQHVQSPHQHPAAQVEQHNTRHQSQEDPGQRLHRQQRHNPAGARPAGHGGERQAASGLEQQHQQAGVDWSGTTQDFEHNTKHGQAGLGAGDDERGQGEQTLSASPP